MSLDEFLISPNCYELQRERWYNEIFQSHKLRRAVGVVADNEEEDDDEKWSEISLLTLSHDPTEMIRECAERAHE